MDIFEDEPCENWDKKKKTKFSFFSGKYLKALQKNKKFKNENQPIVLLNNHCVNDIAYYKDFTDLVYYVGYYPFMREDRLLSSTEFNSLCFDNNSSVISAKIFNILIAILAWKNTASKRWLEIWAVEKSLMDVERKMLLGKVPVVKKITLIPLLDEGTIVLLRIDLEQRKINIYNPRGVTDRESHEYLLKFIHLLKKFNEVKSLYATFKKIKETGWRIQIDECATTTSIFEGCLWVIHLIDSVIKFNDIDRSVPNFNSYCVF